MQKMKEIFSIYGGLKRELYILAFGRVVTSMGALIWPMLTLILKSKLGYNAAEIGMILMIVTMIMIPMNLIGGKLADHFNKKMIIVYFDLLSIVCYIVAGLMELSNTVLVIYFIGSIFQHMESPAYDALIADLSLASEREKAYSLSYLAANLGLVLSPIIGGLLFEDYLGLAFIISGVSILISTVLIYFFGILSIGSIIYAQFNFLIPLTLEEMFVSRSAFYFGILTSVNATVVIFGTPIFTKISAKIPDLNRLMLGKFLEGLGLSMYIFIHTQFYLCIISMIIFTCGEILSTLSQTPYLTKRIPASHRGRVLSIAGNITYVVGSMANLGIGAMVQQFSLSYVWMFIALLGVLEMLFYMIYRRFDRVRFSLLYENLMQSNELPRE